MPATRLTCTVCKKRFYGRIDALYCSSVCRQRAYRARRDERGESKPTQTDSERN